VMDQSELKAARRLLESSRTPSGRLRAEARRGVVESVERARASGMTYASISVALGVDLDALHRWRWTERVERPAMVAVRVQEPVRAASLVVHGPRGLRIEGLTVGELADLVQRLS
jgi:transposase